MSSFYFDSAAQLSDIIIPMTEENAREILTTAAANEDGWVSAAFYYNMKNGKRASTVAYITLHDDQPGGFCNLTDYHPRKDGKATLVYQTDVTLNW